MSKQQLENEIECGFAVLPGNDHLWNKEEYGGRTLWLLLERERNNTNSNLYLRMA